MVTIIMIPTHMHTQARMRATFILSSSKRAWIIARVSAQDTYYSKVYEIS